MKSLLLFIASGLGAILLYHFDGLLDQAAIANQPNSQPTITTQPRDTGGLTKAEIKAVEGLIDHSPTMEELNKARAKVPPKYVVAMLDLYGTPQEVAQAKANYQGGERP